MDVKQVTCSYCGAADNGTCAYPSEGKPGCLLPANREKFRSLSMQETQRALGAQPPMPVKSIAEGEALYRSRKDK